MHKLSILKRYVNHTGRRFAAVVCSCGRRVDVVTRGGTLGPNAWGDSVSDETRVAWIKNMAERLLDEVGV